MIAAIAFDIRESRMANGRIPRMESLKPQDVVVVLKLCALAARRAAQDLAPPRPPMAVLGFELGMSSSVVHAAIKRAHASGLLRYGAARPKVAPPPPISPQSEGRAPELLPRSAGSSLRFRPPGQERPNVTAIIEFLVHGLKYVFPPQRGELTRGIPTSYAAPPLRDLIKIGAEPIPVWPIPEGTERGVAFEPLYRTAPFAALRDHSLYELLAITDALREGRARERKIAEEQLRLRLENTNVD